MSKSKTRTLYSPELREQAVRMLQEQREEYPSRWAAIGSVAAKIGCTPQTIDNWTKQAERDNGERAPSRTHARTRMTTRARLTSDERERLRALERENRELRQTNELLRKASRTDAEPISSSEPSRRERILLEASKSFLHKGYLATSVDEIAEAAGTGGPAVYRFFKSKQDILDTISLIGTDIKLRGIQQAIAKGHRDPKDTLRDLVKNRIELSLGPWGCQSPITEAEYQHLSPATAARVNSAAEFGRAEWLRCLAQIRPEITTGALLSIISTVIMEINYVGLHAGELDVNVDIRPILQRIAWEGLMS